MSEHDQAVRMPKMAYFQCFRAIVWREVQRFVHQRGRFIAALVRPIVWLTIFAAGLRPLLELSVNPPYSTNVTYETYITPGLLGMIQLFNGMQSSLSMVYDREMGNMRILLVSPFPRWFLLMSKLAGGVFVSLLQVYSFLFMAWLWGVQLPVAGYIAVMPVLVLTGFMLGSIGLALSSAIRQLENFAGVMNFVIFPTFFLSSALYPLSQMQETNSIIHAISLANPFTQAVELMRYALLLEVEWTALALVMGYCAAFVFLALLAYTPARGMMFRPSGMRRQD